MVDLESIIANLLPGIAPSHALIFFLLIFTRFLMMSLMLPIFGAQILPMLVRVALSMLLSAMIFLMMIDQASELACATTITISLLFFKEALIGFLVGFLAGLLFYGYELFGELVDLTRGAGMSKLLVPELRHQSSALGTLFFQLALALAFALGLHRPIISAAFHSFRKLPVVATQIHFLSLGAFPQAIEILSTLFESATKLAMPVILITFIIDLTFGFINRVAPQINAYFLSLPAKMVGGLLILFFSLPFLIDDFAENGVHLNHFLLQFTD